MQHRSFGGGGGNGQISGRQKQKEEIDRDRRRERKERSLFTAEMTLPQNLFTCPVSWKNVIGGRTGE